VWSITTAIARGTFRASHVASCPDVAPECASIAIPDHEHHVELTLLHTELSAAYGVRPGLALSLRLPYDVKKQHVHYTTLAGAPFAPPYGDIHHRTETLRGVSDGALLLRWAASPEWRFAIGATLPLGDTEEDPVAAGREGRKHEHLQFGSGVFAPEFEIGWSRANLSAMLQATIPLTTNSRGFRAPKNVRWSAGPSFNVARVGVNVSAAGQYQTIGRWHGETDEGTGFVNGGIRLQLSIPARSLTIAPSIYRELYSRGFNEETFAQGTTVGVAVRATFAAARH
jgi:hypothetical protein